MFIYWYLVKLTSGYIRFIFLSILSHIFEVLSFFFYNTFPFNVFLPGSLVWKVPAEQLETSVAATTNFHIYSLQRISFLFFFFFCSGFCHTLKWNSHGFTCVPHPDPPTHLPLHTLPLGFPSAPGPSACLMHPTWAGDLFHLHNENLKISYYSFYF